MTEVKAHNKHAYPIADERQAKGFDVKYWRDKPMFISPHLLATVLLNHFVLTVHHYVGVVGLPVNFECACGWKSTAYLMVKGDEKYPLDPNGPQVEWVKHIISIL